MILIFSGCGPAATRPVEGGDPELHANGLLAEGHYALAAKEFLRLAGLYPKRFAYYQLRSAHARLDAGEIEAADELLREIEARGPVDVQYRRLLLARMTLLRGDPASALSRAPGEIEGLPDFLSALRHDIRAAALEASGDYLAAVQERVLLDSYQPEGSARRENIQRLWLNLNFADESDLRRLTGSTESDPAAWAELALMQRSLATKPELLRPSLSSWIESHSGHPAIPLITDRILADSERYLSAPAHVALLLPFSGQYAEAARAIRDGFLSAWYQEEEYRPRISIYDANALNVLDQYRSAVDAGAGIVVGPLEKTAIGALIASARLSVTTLALNRRDADTGPGYRPEPASGGESRLIEFGLAPEDEAIQAARRGFFDGHTRALVITPDNDWGDRLNRAFSGQWQAFGGRVIEQIRYGPDATDFSAPVKELLNIDSSESREALLRQRLGRRLESEPRVREDADMVFLAAVPVFARQIVPQLRYHRAEHLAVYASSHVFSGVVDPQVGADMDGVLFPDMPWVLSPRTEDTTLRDAVNRNWSADASSFRRLYAFGIDAFRIIPHLGRLELDEGSSYSGETGDLYLSRDGRIQRRLLWARFANGRPSLIDDQ